MKVGEHALLKGVGALGYETAVTRYTTDANVVPHAHSFVVQTFADFGLIGIALMVALLTAWVIATRRTLTRPDSDWRAGERAGLLTMLAVVVDVRRALRDRLDVVRSRDRAARAAVRGMAGRPRAVGRRRGTGAASAGVWWTVPGSGRPAIAHRRGHAAVPVGGVAAAAGRERRHGRDRRVRAGNTKAALDDARTAAARDPLTVDPLFQLAAMYTAIGNRQAARDELVSATVASRRTRRRGSSSASSIFRSTSPRQRSARWSRARTLDLGSAEISQALSRGACRERARGLSRRHRRWPPSRERQPAWDRVAQAMASGSSSTTRSSACPPRVLHTAYSNSS